MRSKPLDDATDGGPESGVVAIRAEKPDPAALVAGVLAGNRTAYARFFDRAAPIARRTLQRTLGSTRDLEDLTQDTLFLVIRRLATLREPSALTTFVAAIAVHVARNELRRRAFRRFIGLDDVPESSRCVEPVDPSAVQGARELERALAALGTERRIAFVLRHVDGYELKEAADVAGCSLATFKRRLARAEAQFEALCRSSPVLQAYLETREP